MDNKRVLIIGAGRGQVGLYKAAKRMGLTSIAAGYPGNYPGLELADEICSVDISNPDAVVEAAKGLDIDAVVTSCMDVGVESVGAVNDALGLRGVSRLAARNAFDKVLQKQYFAEYDVPTARFIITRSDERLAEAEDAFGYPLVIKKRHSQSSDGVYVVRTHEEAVEALKLVVDGEEFLIEEYLDGDEFGAQAFVEDGEIRFVMPHGDLLFISHAPIPVGHYTPLGMDDAIYEESVRAAELAIRASKFDNCAVNIDFRLDKGRVCLVELTGRAGANGLPELVSMNMGVDYYESVLRLALGLPVEFNEAAAPGAALVKMVLPSQNGVLKEVSFEPVAANVFDIQAFVKAGDEVRSFTSQKDTIGMVATHGSNLDVCIKLADEQIARTYCIVPND